MDELRWKDSCSRVTPSLRARNEYHKMFEVVVTLRIGTALRVREPM